MVNAGMSLIFKCDKHGIVSSTAGANHELKCPECMKEYLSGMSMGCSAQHDCPICGNNENVVNIDDTPFEFAVGGYRDKDGKITFTNVSIVPKSYTVEVKKEDQYTEQPFICHIATGYGNEDECSCSSSVDDLCPIHGGDEEICSACEIEAATGGFAHGRPRTYCPPSEEQDNEHHRGEEGKAGEAP